jgi:glycosyltransferase involved in cell wall biosynthesis
MQSIDRLARKPIRRIYLEATSTANNNLNTGIQRVVRNVIKNSTEIAREFTLNVDVVKYDGQFLNRVDGIQSDVPKAKVYGAIAACWRYFLKLVCVILPSKRARQFIRAPAGRFGLTWLLLSPFRQFRHLNNPLPATDTALALIDASWEYPSIWPQVEEFKRRGGIVVGIVYDIIPISHPELCTDKLTIEFKEWLFKLLEVADGIVCISAFSARCLEEVVDERVGAGLLGRRPIVSHFHLGAELDLAHVEKIVAADMQEIFEQDDHIFLVVGSIEPRKNHSYILDAFELFWASGGRSKLLIIGKHGWKSDEFLDRVAAHPNAGANLHVLRNASDADLEFAYKNASALVFASKIEGFGLPIMESFQRGLPVLCSDIPVFQEIARGKATFFDLSDPTHLKDALTEFCNAHVSSERTVRTPQPYITWKESTRQLFKEITEICEQVEERDDLS